MNLKTDQISVVIIGASGAVGSETLKTLLQLRNVSKITILGRRIIPDLNSDKITQYNINVFNSSSYLEYLKGHTSAICTLGVGEPSKMSKEEFIKIDKTAVLDFAKSSKESGIKHFELLASVAIDHNSSSFYLRTKGELVEELKKLNFERLSIFQPSMILTPTNRYGISQAIILKLWPLFQPIFWGSLRKYRGIAVNILGDSMAKNIFIENKGFEILTWDEFNTVSAINTLHQ